MKILADIDLGQNLLKNVILEVLQDDPVDPKVGRFYYNSNYNEVRYWIGDKWATARSKVISCVVADSGNYFSIIDSSDQDEVILRGLHGDSYIRLAAVDGVIDLTLDTASLPVSDAVQTQLDRLETLVQTLSERASDLVYAAGIRIDADSDGNVYVDYDTDTCPVSDAEVDDETGDVYIEYTVQNI